MQGPVGHYATTDTKVAATLATVGVRIRQQDPISRVVQKGRETWHYWFELDGANGVPTAKIVQAIIEGQEACESLRSKLPDLPGARASLFNRENLLDLGHNKCRRLVMVNLPGGGIMLADEKLSPETKRQVAQMVL
jgi:hypothetical protein